MAADSATRSVFGLLRSMWRFRRYVVPHWVLIMGGAVAALAEIGFRLLEPWPLKFILDRVIQPDPGLASTGVAIADALEPGVLLVLSALGLVVVTGLRGLASYLSTVAFALVGNRVLTTVRSDLYQHLQRLSVRFHSKARQGDLLTRVIGDVGRLQEVAVTAALPLMINVLTLVGMVAVMFWLNWLLALVALVMLPVIFRSVKRKSNELSKVAKRHREVESDMASVAAESLAAIEVVQAYSLESVFEETFTAQNRKNLKEGVKAKRMSAAMERKTDVFVAVATGLTLLVGALLVLRGELTAGDLIVFTTYLKSAFKPMRDLSKYSARLAKASASAERIHAVLSEQPDVTEPHDAKTLLRVDGALAFDRVSFSYDGKRTVLENLNIRIAPGQMVGVVGPSGSGKSSLTSLLLRLHDPTSGRVTIDGYDLREVSLRSLRRHVSIVLQDSVLFRGTIAENIALGQPDASPDAIVEAARLANAHDFITRLPDGYGTVVGERGATLSGGERQRIAIARAALRASKVVILDEPTTGLDRESERTVMEAVQRLRHNRTIIHIAHDLPTVRNADWILFIEHGRVVEWGTHGSLMAQGGRYADMYRIQVRSAVGSESHAVS